MVSGMPEGSLRIIGFPGRYVQGPGAVTALGALLTELGCRSAVLISDDVVEAVAGAAVNATLSASGVPLKRLRFEGECTRGAVSRLAEQSRELNADVVIGLGGGKTIDSAKGVALSCGTRLAILPTVASNDSPTSRLIVLYDDDHRLVGVDMLTRNPDLVLVDTEWVVRAPVRFFRAGIGDALSKSFEAAQCARAGGRNFFGGSPPALAGLMADRCLSIILAEGEAALADVAAQRSSAAVERVTEATVLLSGLGFESGGLSIAHALLRGLSTIPATAGALHGEMVAFGTLVQRVLEGASDDALNGFVRVLRRLGLPSTLNELGGPLDATQRMSVAQLTLAAPYAGNFQRTLRCEEVADAIARADAVGHG